MNGNLKYTVGEPERHESGEETKIGKDRQDLADPGNPC